jgi:hypothetical protein
MKMWFKKQTVPVSNDTKEIDVVQLWEVRWRSRYGEYSSNTKPQVECFISEEDARDFAKALENAFKLIRHTHPAETKVTVTKGKEFN